MMTARKTAREIVERYGINDPFELCDIMDVTVIAADLPESVRGFSLCIQGRRIIYLNELLSSRMMRQVCAHELGHTLLHPDLNLLFMLEKTLFEHQKFEREADEFCAALLFEPEMLSETSSIRELAELAGVDLRIAEMMLDGVRNKN